jgi:hypothetical protein
MDQRKSLKQPTRPPLRRLPPQSEVEPGLWLTMRQGEWNVLLKVAYEMGAVLLELDDNGKPVAAYQRPEPEVN